MKTCAIICSLLVAAYGVEAYVPSKFDWRCLSSCGDVGKEERAGQRDPLEESHQVERSFLCHPFVLVQL